LNLINTLPPEVRSQARAGRFPEWFEPMTAKLAHEPFSREGWLFEPKLNGVRCLVFRNSKDVELWSRNHQRLTRSACLARRPWSNGTPDAIGKTG
jgi:ATP-dependent DNA ligase